MKLSAVVITLNEEKRIERCLRSLAFADEIVVVDSGSTDRTRDIARGLGAKVFERRFDDFSSQKNFAVSCASGEWIFSVDADETVSPVLAAEVRKRMDESAFAAYAVQRRTRLFGREFRYSGLQEDKPIRLFLKSKARFKNAVHEVVEVDGKTGLLKETLAHESFQTVGEHWRRLQHYTDLESLQGGCAPGRMRMLVRPVGRFLSLYIGRQGFRDGREGFVYAVLSGYYEFVRWAKLWEKRKARA